jgi:hypothetical protein
MTLLAHADHYAYGFAIVAIVGMLLFELLRRRRERP